MSTIPIITVVDCMSIINLNNNISPGTAETPTPIPLGNPYIFMLTNSDFAINSNQASSVLEVVAKPGDSINWTMTSVDQGLQYSANIIKITSFNSELPFSIPESPIKTYTRFIGPRQGATPVPLTQVEFQEVISGAAINAQPNPGTYQYKVVFTITDNDGQVKGYYYWTPLMLIPNAEFPVS